MEKIKKPKLVKVSINKTDQKLIVVLTILLLILTVFTPVIHFVPIWILVVTLRKKVIVIRESGKDIDRLHLAKLFTFLLLLQGLLIVLRYVLNFEVVFIFVFLFLAIIFFALISFLIMVKGKNEIPEKPTLLKIVDGPGFKYADTAIIATYITFSAIMAGVTLLVLLFDILFKS